MKISRKNREYLLAAGGLGALIAVLLLVGEIMLPFLFALFIAYLLNPWIIKIQRWIKNRNLAITTLLLLLILSFSGAVFLFGSHIVSDSKRLVGAVKDFTVQNKDQIQEYQGKLLNLFDEVSEHEMVQSQIQNLDSVSVDGESLSSAVSSVYGLFTGKEETELTTPEPEPESWSTFSMIFYTLIYLIFILYTYSYFEGKRDKYILKRKIKTGDLSFAWDEFQRVFITYFQQRSKVAGLNILLLGIAFSIMGLPGAIIIAIATGVLSYASHFHYLSLPLTAIGCWVLSVEQDASFLIFFGIVVALYILISVLEETIYMNYVMKSVRAMNPAVTLLAFTLWVAVFGGFTGTIIALPLTQLIMIYLDRIITKAA